MLGVTHGEWPHGGGLHLVRVGVRARVGVGLGGWSRVGVGPHGGGLHLVRVGVRARVGVGLG